MDLDKFFRWRRAAAIVSLAAGPVRVVPRGAKKPRDRKPYEMCERIFKELEVEGQANCLGPAEGGVIYILAPGPWELPANRRLADRLMNELVTENQNLVRKLVNQFIRTSAASFEEEDLFQSGLMALQKCLTLFDPEGYDKKGTGASFATYLKHWVRYYIQMDISSQQAIKYPKKAGVPYEFYIRAEAHLLQHGEYPTAEELGVDEKTVEDWRSSAPPVVVPMVRSGGACGAGSDQDGSAGGRVQNDFRGDHSTDEFADPNGLDPEKLLFERIDHEKIKEALALLPPKERLVIELIMEGTPWTGLARALGGVSDQCVNQTRKRALTKIREHIGFTEVPESERV